MTPGEGAARQSGPLTRLGRRLARFAAVYSLGTAATWVIGIAQIALLTRLMPQAEFGTLAILVVYSGLVTLLCNLGVVQGTVISAYGGDEETDDVDDAEPAEGDNRGLLGTGLVSVTCLGVVLVLLSALVAPLITPLILDTHGYDLAVTLATASGVLGSIWRLLSSIPRIERRPGMYVALLWARGLLSLGGAVVFVVAGEGVTGAIAGIVLGKAVALIAAAVIGRHRFRLTFDRADAIALAKKGAPFVGISLGFFVARNADLYLVLHFLGDADVALYRVATRLGSVSSMAVSVTFLAWGPLTRGPIKAALAEGGALGVARARMVTYFVFLAAGVIVVMALWSDVLVRLASKSYSGAASIMVVLAVAAAAQGLLSVLYRMARMNNKLRIYRRIGLLCAIVTTVGGLALIPAIGLDGAAIVAVVAPLIGCVVMLWGSQRGDDPLHLPLRRLGLCAAITAGLSAVGLLVVRQFSGVAELSGDIALTLAYPALMLATGAMPRREARQLLALFAPWRRRIERRQLRERLRLIERRDRELVHALVVRRERPEHVADWLELETQAIMERFVGILRSVGDVGTPGRIDARIGAYLLSRAASTRRDSDGYGLAMRQAAVPLELDRLTEVYGEIRGLPRSTWRDAANGSEETTPSSR